MFLDLAHKRLEVYAYAKRLVVLCEVQMRDFPDAQRYGLVQQIRRAALSVLLNIAEGSTRRSVAERKRYYEISRGSLVEVDAGFDAAYVLGIMKDAAEELGETIVSLYRMLSALIKSI